MQETPLIIYFYFIIFFFFFYFDSIPSLWGCWYKLCLELGLVEDWR